MSLSATPVNPPIWEQLRNIAAYLNAGWAMTLRRAAKELEAVWDADESKRVRLKSLEADISSYKTELEYATTRNVEHVNRFIAAESLVAARDLEIAKLKSDLRDLPIGWTADQVGALLTHQNELRETLLKIRSGVRSIPEIWS